MCVRDSRPTLEQLIFQMFSDDSSIMGCVRNGDESDYRGLVEDFVFWCRINNLPLNTSKTKESVVNFW